MQKIFPFIALAIILATGVTASPVPQYNEISRSPKAQSQTTQAGAQPRLRSAAPGPFKGSEFDLSDGNNRGSAPTVPGHSGMRPQPAAIDFDPQVNYFPIENTSTPETLFGDEPDAQSDPDSQPNPNIVSGGTEIPESEIRVEFPEFKSPRTFSTEKVDYTLRTNSPPKGAVAAPATLGVDNRALGFNGGDQPAAAGEEPIVEENTNVAVFSDDKAFHWSSDKGEALPTNDEQFKEAMSWIGRKFRGNNDEKKAGRKGKGKTREHTKTAASIFDVLMDHA